MAHGYFVHKPFLPAGHFYYFTRYISDYYLQQETNEVSRYENLNENPLNYGVFTLAEGATFRHHTREWIQELLQDMEILEGVPTEVKTMNGHSAMAFQIIARKN